MPSIRRVLISCIAAVIASNGCAPDRVLTARGRSEADRSPDPVVGRDDPQDPGGSHFRYGTTGWAPTGVPGEVEIRLRAAYRRTAYPVASGRCIGACPGGLPGIGDVIVEGQGPTQLSFGDGSVTPVLRFRVTGVDTSDPVDPNNHWIIGEALDPVSGAPGVRHAYAGAGPYTASLVAFNANTSACCRIGQFEGLILNNRPGSPYPIATIVLPVSGNRSPVSGLTPIVFVTSGGTQSFLVPAGDPDGDRIRWRMATDAEAGGCCHPPGMTINAANGVVSWNTTGLSLTGYWTTQVIIEDLDAAGNVKSKTPVDFLLRIVQGVPPFVPPYFVAPSPPDGAAFVAYVGGTLSIPLAARDDDAGQVVTINHAGLPPGASFPIPAPANPVSSAFQWTPTAAAIGTWVVTFFATDNLGLGSLPRSYVIRVIPFVPVLVDIKPGSDPNSVKLNEDNGPSTIPVAVLSSATFDARLIVPGTVTLGDGAGSDVLVSFRNNGTPMASLEDVNRDGRVDLVLHFERPALIARGELTPATTSLVLTGALTDGRRIRGSDAVRVIP